MRGERTSRFVRMAAFVLGLGVLGIFALLPSATATPQPTARAAPVPDLSTVSEIKSYLRSLGVDPRGVVVQRGERNYAGPNCPGASWNCTNALKVIQISTRAVDDDDGDDENENRFVCDGSKPRTITKSQATPAGQTIQTCEIVQLNNASAKNSAVCDLATHRSEGTITQTCKINQSGSRNSAFAKQVARMNASGTEQDVYQTISVKQTSSGSSGNTLDTAQSTLLNTGPSASDDAVKQDVHQLNCVNQAAAGSGPNVARSGQSQILVARKHGANLDAESVDIAQNTETLAVNDCVGPAAPFPATPDHPTDQNECAITTLSTVAKQSANACTRVLQQSASGKNTILLGQLDSVFAEVKNHSGHADVQQGNTAPAQTGTTGTLDQVSTGNGVGKISFGGLTTQVTSINGAESTDSWSVDQTDEGPQCCAAGHQRGNAGSAFGIDGRLFQRVIVDGTVPSDDSELPDNGFIDQDGLTSRDCETDGKPSSNGGCTVLLAASNNVDQEETDCQTTETEPDCHVDVLCYAGESEGFGGSCYDPNESSLSRRPG